MKISSLKTNPTPHIAFYPPKPGALWEGLRRRAEAAQYSGHEFKGEVYNNISLLKGEAPYEVPVERISMEHGVLPTPIIQYFYKAELGDLTTHWIHADSAVGDLAVVMYLPPLSMTSVGGGTALFRHRATGLDTIEGNRHRADVLGVLDMDSDNLAAFEPIANFHETPGWTACYPTGQIHARFPRDGYGVGIQRARIVYVGFFQINPIALGGQPAAAPQQAPVGVRWGEVAEGLYERGIGVK